MQVEQDADERVRAGAGAPDVKLALGAAKFGLSGISFYRGIPGTIGGALRMNAGAYGGETKDVLVEAKALDHAGEMVTLGNAAMGFSYRRSAAPEHLIFVEAVFQGREGDEETIRAEMQEITGKRSSTQPVNTHTGGSTFKNPPGRKSWELIDAAGLPRLAHRQCASLRASLQLPDQPWGRQRRGDRGVGRRGAPARARNLGRRSRMGDQARGRGGAARGMIEARGRARHSRARLSNSLDASFTVKAESMKFDAPHQHLLNRQCAMILRVKHFLDRPCSSMFSNSRGALSPSRWS